jgi:hypothetical protein
MKIIAFIIIGGALAFAAYVAWIIRDGIVNPDQ